VFAINPVADAAAVRMTRRRGSDFGTLRAWGTLGFMAVNAVTGLVVAGFGSAAFVPLIVVLSLMRGGASLQLPRFRAPLTDAPVPPARSILVAGRVRELFRPWFVLPLVGNAIILATHLLLNAFAALVWRDAGISASIIGPLIALSAAAEAVMMFTFRRLSKRFSARHLILISALASAVRWAVMAFNPPIAVLVVLQLSHSVTFAMGYLGGVNFIANWTSEDIAAEAQSVLVVLQQALTVAALAGFGYLVAIMGARAFMVSAGFSLLAGGAVWISLRLMTAGRERDEESA
jgi:MFS transporter, PPP family, 3-phenylpropionic acid transporter